MAKHTPGPWVVGDERYRDQGCIVIHTPDNESIASAWNLFKPGGGPANTPMEANALLIAAAPELLAALKKVWRYVPFDAPERDVVVAAVAKAEGASP